MKCLITILILFCLLAALSCERPKTITTDENIEVIQNVRQTLNDYYDDIRESGLTAEFKYLDDSKEFFWTPPGYSSAISYDSVVTILKQNAPLYQSIDNQWDTLRVTPLTKSLAAYTGRLRSTMTDTSGHVFSVKLVETGLLIKRHDGWKLLCGQTATISD
ncbi:MAG: nuclear transport factor 2 family protein [Allomuricauda sp.]